MVDRKYQSSDVVLLAAIEFSSGEKGANIRDIIGAGDYINHAIFTEKEIRGGLFRLLCGGWIIEIGNCFATSKKFRDQKIKYSTPTGRHSTRKLRMQIREMLEVSSGSDDLPLADNEEYKKTVKEYREGF